MFKEKVVAVPPKKEDVVVIMVLVVTTYNQIPENVVFKTRVWLIYKRRKKFHVCLKKLSKTCNRMNLQGSCLELVYKLLL